jgi:hypothetical protein
MRCHWFLLAVLAVALPAVREARSAGDCGCEAHLVGIGCGASDPGGGSCLGHGCGLLGSCGLFGHKCKGPRYEGLDAHFNCGCNGSYKFPVPPLYTYHWPGMWQQHLMTDYHSPWRFPPLKPYVDELLAPVETGRGPALARPIRTVSHAAELPQANESHTFSRRLERATR